MPLYLGRDLRWPLNAWESPWRFIWPYEIRFRAAANELCDMRLAHGNQHGPELPPGIIAARITPVFGVHARSRRMYLACQFQAILESVEKRSSQGVPLARCGVEHYRFCRARHVVGFAEPHSSPPSSDVMRKHIATVMTELFGDNPAGSPVFISRCHQAPAV
ncbi:MAG: hypothetical protein L0387_42885 [Acidobacteria bacterium]|nr:hypothetical protein [Acidobacteriota bacterium]